MTRSSYKCSTTLECCVLQDCSASLRMFPIAWAHTVPGVTSDIPQSRRPYSVWCIRYKTLFQFNDNKKEAFVLRPYNPFIVGSTFKSHCHYGTQRHSSSELNKCSCISPRLLEVCIHFLSFKT